MAAGEIGVRRTHAMLGHAGVAVFRPLQAFIAWPTLLFFATLVTMLFRPPDLDFYDLDRIALALLAGVVGLRALVLRQSFAITGPVTFPLLMLMGFGLAELLSHPFQSQDWSTFAAKWAVPFLLYHLAQLVFVDTRSLQQFEIFLLVMLGYLSLTAIFFMVGAKQWIFPSFILDESLGIHVDRARGPFLQAVANGVSLTLLGLIALDSYRRGRLQRVLAVAFLFAVPAAVLATKTRSVWISFAGGIFLLWVSSSSRRVRRACACLVIAGVTVISVAYLPAGKMLLLETGWRRAVRSSFASQCIGRVGKCFNKSLCLAGILAASSPNWQSGWMVSTRMNFSFTTVTSKWRSSMDWQGWRCISGCLSICSEWGENLKLGI